MHADSSNIDQLAALLQPNSLVLTPNQRLSRSLTTALTSHLKHKKLAWHTPNILPLNTWLQTLASTLQFEGLIPAKPYAQIPEELDLWRQIISETDQTLVRPKSVAKLARSAYISLREWQLSIDNEQLVFDADEDTAAYRSWHIAYEQKVPNQVWQTAVDIAVIIARELGHINSHIILVGFHDLAPLYKTIVDKADSVKRFTWKKQAATLSAVECENRYTELNTMASWARRIADKQPEAKIALCVPDLNQSRAEVLHALDMQFQDEAVLPGQFRQLHFYDISAGVALSDTPVGKVFLQLLQLVKRPQKVETWLFLYQSPYCQLSGGHMQTELARLHKFPLPEANLGQLATWLGDLSKLDNIHQSAKNLVSQQNLNEWAVSFKQWAEQCGWPGQRTLSSDEYQQHQICLQALDTFGQLSLQKRRYSFHQAADILNDIFNDKVYHAETPSTNISVLGSLEASGQVFDYLWITGMDDTRWPAKLSPNPFIPISLQQQYEMPRGSVNREYYYATAMLNQFAQAADNIVLSYECIVDGVSTSVSRLLESQARVISLPIDKPYRVHKPAAFEAIEYEDIPVLSSEHQIAASALVDQSHCAFKAFASRRLKLKASLQRSFGLSAMDRGNLLHAAFEAFFTQCRSAESVADLQPDSLDKAIEAAALQAINQFPLAKKRLFNKAFFTLEQQRLQALLHEWLAQGDGRSINYQLAELEYELETSINGLMVTLRVDRIDKINGQWFIIDYKSSSPMSINWQAERLMEPQLPLYAVALTDHKICGIAVAHIKPNETTMNATGNGTAGLDKPLDDTVWQALLVQWQQQIHQLADEYRLGVNTVSPIKPQVCTYCDFNPLCRIFDVQEEH